MANKISELHFNKSTMLYRKKSPQNFGNSIGRYAEMKNDCGFHDFFFLYGFSYRIHDYAIYISCRDHFGTEHRMTMFADHPDSELLKNYIAEY